MRSRRIRGGGALVAVLAVVFAVVPAVLRGGDDVSELDGTDRAMLVSLDTPAPGTQPAPVPTVGSQWAMVDVPDPGGDPGALPPGLVQAVVDRVQTVFAAQLAPGAAPTVDIPVAGVAGSGPSGSVEFTGSASDSITITIALPGGDWVITISLLRVTTVQPVTPPSTQPPDATPDVPPSSTTEPAPTTTEPPTTSTEPPSTTTTTDPPTSDPSTTSTTDPSTTTTTTTDPSTTSTTDPSTTTTTTTDPSTTTTTTTTQPPAGQPVTVPVRIGRDVRLWPFASDSIWNTPRGAGAVFDSRPVVPGPVNINTTAYGVSIGGAGYPFVAQNANSERHEFQVQPDGVTAFGTSWFLDQFDEHTVVDLLGSGVNVTVPGNPGHYERATKISGYGGPLRDWELEAAQAGDVHAIKHAIALAMSSHVLDQTHVWPAFAHDSFAPTNSGFMPEGAFMAIPGDAQMPDGLNNVARAVWQAMHDYGAYAVDATGQNGGSTDSLTVVEAEASADGVVNTIRGGQIAAVASQLRWVTNADHNDVGGPGARLAPLAPDFGSQN